MELTYRGYQYQTALFRLEECGEAPPCTYRGRPYQLKHKRVNHGGSGSVNLVYRGVAYTRKL
ncbi:MAG: DUF4278 domain-containing protein [Elainellaceae cyanobacterium]